MTFANAYDPFRALKVAWRLLKKAPGTVLVGGILLLIIDGFSSGSSNNNASGDFGGASGGLEGVETSLLVLIVLIVLALAIGFWLFGCLIRIGFPNAIEKVLESGEESIGTIFKAQGLWPTMVGATLLKALASIAAVLPLGLAALVGFLVAEVTDEEQIGLFAGLVTGLLYLPVLI